MYSDLPRVGIYIQVQQILLYSTAQYSYTLVGFEGCASVSETIRVAISATPRRGRAGSWRARWRGSDVCVDDTGTAIAVLRDRWRSSWLCAAAPCSTCGAAMKPAPGGVSRSVRLRYDRVGECQRGPALPPRGGVRASRASAVHTCAPLGPAAHSAARSSAIHPQTPPTFRAPAAQIPTAR